MYIRSWNDALSVLEDMATCVCVHVRLCHVSKQFWCCLSRPCVVFLACVHLALFLALFLSPGNSLVFSWCDHSMLASSLWQCLAVPSLLQLCWEPTHLVSLLSTKHAESFLVLSSQRPQDVFLHSSWMSSSCKARELLRWNTPETVLEMLSFAAGFFFKLCGLLLLCGWHCDCVQYDTVQQNAITYSMMLTGYCSY